jgi:hypothetical protein
MNIMEASEKHKLLIIAVDHELWVYQFHPKIWKFDEEPFKKINLNNENVAKSLIFRRNLSTKLRKTPATIKSS